MINFALSLTVQFTVNDANAAQVRKNGLKTGIKGALELERLGMPK